MSSSKTLYDTDASLYAQLARSVMNECDIRYNSKIISMPDGEHLQPWYARINPKMEVPTL